MFLSVFSTFHARAAFTDRVLLSPGGLIAITSGLFEAAKMSSDYCNAGGWRKIKSWCAVVSSSSASKCERSLPVVIAVWLVYVIAAICCGTYSLLKWDTQGSSATMGGLITWAACFALLALIFVRWSGGHKIRRLQKQAEADDTLFLHIVSLPVGKYASW